MTESPYLKVDPKLVAQAGAVFGGLASDAEQIAGEFEDGVQPLVPNWGTTRIDQAWIQNVEQTIGPSVEAVQLSGKAFTSADAALQLSGSAFAATDDGNSDMVPGPADTHIP